MSFHWILLKVFVSLPRDEGFLRPAVPLVKEGFIWPVGSMTWTIIGSALTARVSERLFDAYSLYNIALNG